MVRCGQPVFVVAYHGTPWRGFKLRETLEDQFREGGGGGGTFPSFYPAATPDPYGQIPPGQDHYWEPQQATASQVFSDCYGCVWGATDPGGPIETDWELENPDLEFQKRPTKPGIDTIKDRKHNERKPSGENNERKELREEVNKIKRLIGY